MHDDNEDLKQGIIKVAHQLSHSKMCGWIRDYSIKCDGREVVILITKKRSVNYINLKFQIL